MLFKPPKGKQQQAKDFKTYRFRSGSELLKNQTVPGRADSGRKSSPESWLSLYSLLEALYSVLRGGGRGGNREKEKRKCCDAANLAP